MSDKLLRWLIFSVLIALCPIVSNALILLTKDADASLAALVGRGELLLIVAGMCARGLGQLVAAGTGTYRKMKLIAAGGSIRVRDVQVMKNC